MNKAIRWNVFIPLVTVCLIFIILGLQDSRLLVKNMDLLTIWFLKHIGWLFQIVSLLLLFATLYIGFSQYGSIRLGGKDAQPLFSTFSWVAITLCSGIAVGIVIWGISEPVWHFRSPPSEWGVASGSERAAIASMAQVFLHWTLTPYSLYCFYGVLLGFAIHNAKLSDRISSILHPIFKNKTDYWVGDIIDTICTIAIIGGVTSNFGQSVLLLNKGLGVVSGLPTNGTSLTGIILFFTIFVLYINLKGIRGGLKRVSQVNAYFYIFLLIFVLLFTNRSFVTSLATTSLGYYLKNFFTLSLHTSPIENSNWAIDWSIYYWAVWLSYAPLLGMFFAKISYGRTLKEFISVNLLTMAGSGFLWFTVFGGAAIYADIQDMSIINSIKEFGFESGVYAFFETLPLTEFINVVFIIVIFLSMATLLDSMVNSISYVTVKNTSGTIDAPKTIRVFWIVLIAAVTLFSILGTLDNLNNAINLTKRIGTLAGIPILYLSILSLYSGFKMLKNHKEYDKTL